MRPLKLSGSMHWLEGSGEEGRVSTAIDRGDEIAIDAVYSEIPYNFVLKRAGSEFRSTFRKGGASEGEVIVRCQMFETEDGRFLFGQWREEWPKGKKDYVWWVKLTSDATV